MTMANKEIKTAAEFNNELVKDKDLSQLKQTVEKEQAEVQKTKALQALLTQFHLREENGKYVIDMSDDTGCTKYEFANKEIVQSFVKDILKMQTDIQFCEKDGLVEMTLALDATKKAVGEEQKDVAHNAPGTTNSVMGNNPVINAQNVTVYTNSTSVNAQSSQSISSSSTSSSSSQKTSGTQTNSGGQSSIANSGGNASVNGTNIGNINTGTTNAANTGAKNPAEAPKKKAEVSTEANTGTTHTETMPEQKDIDPKASVTNVLELLKQQMTGGRKIDAQTGKGYFDINVSAAQLSALEMYVSQSSMSGGGKLQEGGNSVDPGTDKLMRQVNRLQSHGRREKAKRVLERASERSGKQAELQKDLNAYMQQTNENINRASYQNNAFLAGMNMYGAGYHGHSVEFAPYIPLFNNICGNVNAIRAGRTYVMNLANGDVARVRCPELMGNSLAGYFDPAGVDRYGNAMGEPGCASKGGFIGSALDKLVGRTGMSEKQKNNLTGIIKIGAGIGLGVFARKALKNAFGVFSNDDKKQKEGRGSMAKIGGVLIGFPLLTGTNIWDAAFHGDSKDMVDHAKKLFNGLVGTKFEVDADAMNTMALYPAYGNILLGDQTIGNLRNYVNQTSNGLSFNDNAFEQYLLMASLQDPKNDKIQTQMKLWQMMKKDGMTQSVMMNYINRTQANPYQPGIDQTKTANDFYTDYVANSKAIADVLAKGHMKVADQKKFDEVVMKAAHDGKKPTIDALMAAGAIVAESADVQGTVASTGTSINATPSAPSTKIEDVKTPEEVTEDMLDPVLKNIADKAVAKKLQFAKVQLNDKIVRFANVGDKMEYTMHGNILCVKSYGREIPIQLRSDNHWYAQMFGMQFDDFNNLVWVANLTNKLIKDKSGTANNAEPFKKETGTKDLKFGSDGRQNFFKAQEVADGGWTDMDSTIKKYGGERFQDSIAEYAKHLNELKNTNGESIWMPAGIVSSSDQIKDRYAGVNAIATTPVTGAASNAGTIESGTTTTESLTKAAAIEKATATNPEAIIDASKRGIDASTINAKAATWKAKYDSYYIQQTGSAMPLDFYKQRAESYGTDGNYRLDFIYDNKPYRRQGGDLPPTRHIDKAKKSWLQGKLK